MISTKKINTSDLNNKKIKGITLITLVITIVILLILAGITILELSRNGLFDRAKQALEETKYANAYEKVKLAVMASYGDNGELNNEELKANINKIDGLQEKITEIKYDLLVKVDGYKFLISKMGEVMYVNDIDTLNIKEDNIQLLKFINNTPIEGNNGKSESELLEYTLTVEEDIDKRKLEWTSSDEGVVKVDQNGKVTIVKNGSAIITCTTKNKSGETLTDTCLVKAKERLYLYYYGNQFTDITNGYVESARTGKNFSCSYNESDIYINCNASYGGGGVFTSNSIDLTEYSSLNVYGNLSDWKTSDSNGRILAISNSKTYGSEWLPSGYIAYNCTNRVSGNQMLTIDTSSIGGNYYICNAFNQSYGYIYEMYLEKIDKDTLNLKEDNIELLKIDNNTQVIGNNEKSETNLLEYTITTMENIDKNKLNWTSSDENIVKVDKSGKVTFVKSGEATITCTMKTGLGEILTDTCLVKAKERLYLYYYGNQFLDITNGYVESARTGRTFSCSYNESDIYINCYASYGGGGVFTSNLIDFTEYSSLNAYGNLTSWKTSDSAGRILTISNSQIYGSGALPSGYITYKSTNRVSGNQILTIDTTSITGSYYVCNAFNQSHGYIYEVWLEK